ncbi:MAG: precorrin-6A reductase [Treponema sp.]|nr:precorrin-6A reductase [Treponema sp.]
MNILVFAGTTEGRLFTKEAVALGFNVFVSVATEYGKEDLLEDSSFPKNNCTILQGRLDIEAIKDVIEKYDVSFVIDATHPYAAIVSHNIIEACNAKEKKYYRLLRDIKISNLKSTNYDAEFSSLKDLCDFLAKSENACYSKGNIFISTGSKELLCFSSIPFYKDRVYVRVLPTVDSIEKCKAAGILQNHIIAMQGPFSKDMNKVMFKDFNIKILVTKESGISGGYLEKIEAAKECSVIILRVKPPVENVGKTYSQEEILEELNGKRKSYTC